MFHTKKSKLTPTIIHKEAEQSNMLKTFLSRSQVTSSFVKVAGRVCMCTTPAASTSAPSSPSSPSTDASPTPSVDSASSQSDRIHSTDIAFKPNSAGWGYSKGYATGFDSIFKKKCVPQTSTTGTTNGSSDAQRARSQSVQDLLQNFGSLSEQNKIDFLSSVRHDYPEFL